MEKKSKINKTKNEENKKMPKPFYWEGNNISYSEDFVKRYKSKILINTILYVWLLSLFTVLTIVCGYFGLSEHAKYKPINITFWVLLPIEIIVIVFFTLHFVFNHVYVKQEKGLKVALYCNWWIKVLEINNIQKDFGSYKKIMIHEVDQYVITIKGKNIDIKIKEKVGN